MKRTLELDEFVLEVLEWECKLLVKAGSKGEKDKSALATPSVEYGTGQGV